MDMPRRPGQPHPRLALPEAGLGDDLGEFQRWLQQAIPQVAHLGIQRMGLEGETLEWHLELAPSLNDKGTGFGGAMASQTILIGWCWLTLWLRQQGRAQDVVIADARQRFLAPVSGDYRLLCEPAPSGGVAALSERLASRGKGRISLVQRLYCGDTLCLEASGDYAVLPSPPA
nr:YiiD C-terminal domain-containing protein [Halomonas socia]